VLLFFFCVAASTVVREQSGLMASRLALCWRRIDDAPSEKCHTRQEQRRHASRCLNLSFSE
jgi:hypothetical protein